MPGCDWILHGKKAATWVAALGSLAFSAPRPDPLGIRTGTISDHSDWTFYDLTVDLSQARFIVLRREGGALLESLVPSRFFAAINGGYFDRAFRPTGWLVDGGREVRKPNLVASGGIFAVSGDKAFVGARNRVPFKPDFIVQNGPLLVEEGGKLGIRRDDGRRAARTVVCLTNSQNGVERPLHLILFQAKPGAGPTLMEAAELLRKDAKSQGFGCSVALNLDGGPSTGVIFEKSVAVPSSPPLVPIGYGIAVVPR